MLFCFFHVVLKGVTVRNWTVFGKQDFCTLGSQINGLLFASLSLSFLENMLYIYILIFFFWDLIQVFYVPLWFSLANAHIHLTFCLFFQSKYMWHTIVWCNFQVYYVFQRWHLCTLWDDHYDKSSNHLSLYKVIVKLLSMFLMLYITSMWLIYYIIGSLCLWIPFTYFMHLPPPFPLSYSYCSIYSLLLFWLVCLDFTCKWDHTVLVFFCLTYFTFL